MKIPDDAYRRLVRLAQAYQRESKATLAALAKRTTATTEKRHEPKPYHKAH